MDEVALTAKTSRAARAQALLNDELLKEAFATLDTEYVKAWRETSARDDDARQRYWQAVNVLGKVRDHLEQVVRDGRVAQADLERLAMTTSKRGKR
jgi:hypothetical protein